MKITFEYAENNVAYVHRCLSALLTTVEGTCPGDRGFGMDFEYISLPPNEAKNLFVIDLNEKLKEFVPGIVVDHIAFSTDGPKLKAHIKFKRGDEEE